MAVVLIAEISGMTREQDRHAIDQVRDQLKAAPGFLAHAGTPTPQGFRITEIWASQSECQQFLEGMILPMAQQAGIPPFQPQFVEADEAFTRRELEAGLGRSRLRAVLASPKRPRPLKKSCLPLWNVSRRPESTVFDQSWRRSPIARAA